MRGTNPVRHLAVGATLLHHALALPQAGITVDPAPIAWVTVDASGSAQTITPSVITTEGHRATVSEAPSNLRSTTTYTLSTSGRPSTYTGLAPVASATGTGGSLAGVFPACDSNANVGAVEPFCLPKPGSELHPGMTYYITWSPTYFSPANLSVSLNVLYLDDEAGGGTTGFTSPPIPASAGFYAFPIPADFLTLHNNPSSQQQQKQDRYNITFLLAYPDDTSTANAPNDLITRVGPTVFITPLTPSLTTPTSPNITPIIVPIILVGAAAMLAVLCTLSWRKNGRARAVVGWAVGKMKMKRRSVEGGGYGQRQSRAERVGGGPWGGGGDDKSETDVGIQLTERDSWSPTGRREGGGGGNVFREEVERQARLG
ncbi:hypothetical protein C8A01DRAFT_18434 [Parachaetomium inaequale]|uniref:Uncharacterized protein n=1 Tax=Parachaetomium inaequale TaxID=2588326 RepID=A0AAN6PCA7_9PEZI|nr:hypothetical protein C8A01DRAFT_18434 [Parachaetomium inaequale]